MLLSTCCTERCVAFTDPSSAYMEDRVCIAELLCIFRTLGAFVGNPPYHTNDTRCPTSRNKKIWSRNFQLFWPSGAQQ